MAHHVFTHMRLHHIHQVLKSSICRDCLHRQITYSSFLSTHTQWNKAVSAAERVVGYPTSFMNLRFWLSDEMSNVAVNMRKLIGTNHPLMKTAKGLLFDSKDGMQTRGLVVLLISKAGEYPNEPRKFLHHSLDTTYSPVAPQSPLAENGNGILATQRSLAEITEMINTAFILHKGVMDIDLKGESRANFDSETEDMLYGNKMALLSGDYLLAKASSGLSSLGNTYVVETMASAISDLMESGFFLDELKNEKMNLELWENWAYKNGASLYAKSCQSALMLSEHPQSVTEKAFKFGKYFGLLRQIKADMEQIEYSGTTTESRLLINRIVGGKEIVKLKETYMEEARKCISILPNGEARAALDDIVQALASSV